MRKEVILTIQGNAKNRDNGKRFKIREMPAYQAEQWALRALHAMMQSDIVVPESLQACDSAAKMASLGLTALAKVPYESLKPLLNEMMGCVVYLAGENGAVENAMIDKVIEEASTYFTLRQEVFKLHLDFFTPEG